MTDADERTTAIGLFNTARSYWRSGEHLRSAKLSTTHPNAPITFLLCHGIELYLKSFLRGVDVGVSELRKIGHQVATLAAESRKRGLEIDSETHEVLSHIQNDNVAIESRYIVTGFKTIPTEQALSNACGALDTEISQYLVKRGFPVRKQRFEDAQSESLRPQSKADADALANFEEDLTELDEQERKIIGYLLHHNQRLFDCALDGGYARRLISRGIVKRATQPGQVFDQENVPMEIPRPIWRLLKGKKNKFPYRQEEHDAYPWRVPWMLR